MKEVRKSSPDRASTDASLLDERAKTDSELARRRTDVESAADDVVQLARQRADDVLQKQRDAADAPGATTGLPVADERARADIAIEEERATEDAASALERDAHRRALTDLLESERDLTDLNLHTERGTSDAAVAGRDSFLAMVSHDLRSMLNGISITAALLLREAPTGDAGTAVRARSETIRRLTTRMNHLIGDLTDIATIESGRPLVKPAQADLQHLIHEVDAAFQPVAAARELAFTVHIEGSPQVAPFDNGRIFQVLANLISNSVKFTPAGGVIALTVDTQGGATRFSVRDTGTGIPKEALDAIFERFWQVGGHDRRGLGLGLYISKCIVEGHGGKIWAESEEREGSTVYFTLPSAGAAVGA